LETAAALLMTNDLMTRSLVTNEPQPPNDLRRGLFFELLPA